jgi:hypothetical protein
MAATSPSPEQQAATIVSVGPAEPYPTGAPPDFSSVPLRVHTPQELTISTKWLAQQQANLLAGGMIAGGAAVP